MSLLKLGGLQIGQSNTASNNFHWRNLLDGLLRLSRGNAGSPITDVMRVKADNSVEFPGGVASGVFGTEQSMQDMTASRSLGSTFTNSTGKEIVIAVASNNNTAGSFLQIYINGGTAYWGTAIGGANHWGAVVGLIPAGANYSASWSGGTPANVVWREQR